MKLLFTLLTLLSFIQMSCDYITFEGEKYHDLHHYQVYYFKDKAHLISTIPLSRDDIVLQ